MLKVLIVEDEILTRVGIVAAVDWQALELEVVAQAGDGLEALHLFQLHKPDIVITDLNMPGLSGTRLIERIYDEAPECRVIVVTCINNIENIRELMPYRVFDYLLKATISTKELTERLTVAKNQILNSSSTPREPEQKKATELREFLEGIDDKYLPFGKEENGYAFLLVMRTKSANTGLLAKALKDILKDYFRECGTLVTAVLQQRNFVVCFQNKALTEEEILSSATRFQEYAWKALNVKILCNLEFCDSAAQLQAICKTYFPLVACCNIVDWGVGTDLTEEYSSRVQRLRSLFSFSIFAREVRQSLCDCFGKLVQTVSFDEYKRIVTAGLRELYTQYDFFSETQTEAVCRKIEQADNFEIVYLHFFYFLDKMADSLIYPVSYSWEIRCALDYIRQNYQKKISLTDVAEAAMLSPNYFSTVFKNSMGVSFINYVIRYRMYCAMKLLRDKSLYLYDISEQVGIPEISHFSKSFKKVTGFSPNEWRKITADITGLE